MGTSVFVLGMRESKNISWAEMFWSYFYLLVIHLYSLNQAVTEIERLKYD